MVDAIPGERFSFRVTAGLEVAEWSYTFESTAGGCRITEAWTDESGSIVLRLSRLVAGVEDRGAHNRAGMEQTLDRLEAAAESA